LPSCSRATTRTSIHAQILITARSSTHTHTHTYISVLHTLIWLARYLDDGGGYPSPRSSRGAGSPDPFLGSPNMTRGSGSAGPQAAFLASNDPSALRDNDDAVNFRGVQNEWVGLLATLEQAAGLGWAGCWRKRGARGVDSGGHERGRQCTAAHARIVRMHATVQVRAQRPGDFSVRGPPPRRATATRVGKQRLHDGAAALCRSSSSSPASSMAYS
jgi:hypothetical protein